MDILDNNNLWRWEDMWLTACRSLNMKGIQSKYSRDNILALQPIMAIHNELVEILEDAIKDKMVELDDELEAGREELDEGQEKYEELKLEVTEEFKEKERILLEEHTALRHNLKNKILPFIRYLRHRRNCVTKRLRYIRLPCTCGLAEGIDTLLAMVADTTNEEGNI